MARVMIMALCVVVTYMVVATPHAEAIECADVTASLEPCLHYIINGGTVPQECCSAIQELNASVSTTSDRQDVCRCLTAATGAIPGINLNVVANLPVVCGIDVNFEINPNVDCSQVQ